MDEKQAIRRLKAGDESALSWLIDRYAAYVTTIIHNILGPAASQSDGEEVASEVFYALWLQADQVREDKLKPYLGAIARNKARERLRKQGRDLPLEDDLLILAPEDPERELVEREQAAFLRETLLALPHPDRDIFFRYYYDCQPVKLIAQALGLNPATVKTKLHRGRKKLKEVLTKGGYPIEDQNF